MLILDDYFQLRKIQMMKMSASNKTKSESLSFMKNTNPDQSDVESRYQKIVAKIPKEFHVYAPQ